MQKVSVLKALCQGISFNKEKAKKRTQARTEKFTIEEGEALLEEDEDLLCGALKHIDTIDKLNNAEFRQQRPERERKAINRYRDKVSKLLKTTKMKLTGADIPVPSLDFSHIVKYDRYNCLGEEKPLVSSLRLFLRWAVRNQLLSRLSQSLSF